MPRATADTAKRRWGSRASTWLFAEGSQGFFHTYLLLLNPNAEATTATLTFLPEREPAVVRTFDLPPMSRLVVDAGDRARAPRPLLRDRDRGDAADPGRAGHVLREHAHAALRRRPRVRRCAGSLDDLALRRGRHRRVLRHLRPARQPGHDAGDGHAALPARQRHHHHAGADGRPERPADGGRGAGRSAAGQRGVLDRGHLRRADRGGAHRCTGSASRGPGRKPTTPWASRPPARSGCWRKAGRAANGHSRRTSCWRTRPAAPPR